jgi:hypothetical protein
MKLRQLVLREIAYRRFNFAMGLLSVAVAAACGVGAVFLLRALDTETEQLQASHEQAAQRIWEEHTSQIAVQEMAAKTAWEKYREEVPRLQQASRKAWDFYQDQVRKDMLELGFNLMILHKDQNLSDPDENSKTLPESYAAKLAASKLVDINHLLPFLQQKFWWPERKRWITLVGTTGEVYIKDPNDQKPMLQKISSGSAFLGYAIHQSLDLRVGDRFTLGGREFAVEKCLPAKGFQEDENIYVTLGPAQELLGRKGRITGMLAINCLCNPEGVLGIQNNIRKLLPDTRVIEHSSQLIARASVRANAAREADAALAREGKILKGAADKAQAELERMRHSRDNATASARASQGQQQKSRADQRGKRATFSAVLIGLVVLVSSVFLGALMWDNVHRRQAEIGILRAIGVARRRILLLFLGKALLIGVAGAVIGYCGGLAMILVRAAGAWPAGLFDPVLLGGTILAAALLSALASWIPARMAAGIDPGLVLQREGL